MPALKREDDIRRLIRDFQAFSEEVDAISRDYFNHKETPQVYSGHGFLPPLDTFETETEFACLVELAGVAPQDLKVSLDGAALTVSGVRRQIPGFEKRQYLKMELDFGYFERLITIPERLKPGTLQVENMGGFYLIRMQKTQPGFRQLPDSVDHADPDTRR